MSEVDSLAMDAFDALYNPNVWDPFTGHWFDPKQYFYVLDIEVEQMVIQQNHRVVDPPFEVAPIPERYYGNFRTHQVTVPKNYVFCPGVDRKRVAEAVQSAPARIEGLDLNTPD